MIVVLVPDDVRDPSFWSTQAGAELDLRFERGGRAIGVEVKRTDRPAMSASIRSALQDLELDHVVVVHAGHHRFPLAHNVTAVPATEALVTGLSDVAGGVAGGAAAGSA